VSVPEPVRKELRARLWKIADELGWKSLSPNEKKRRYEDWTRDPAFGGTLGRYLDNAHVRVYIKDTLLKEYSRQALADASRPLRAVNISASAPFAEAYQKPHGRRFPDGKVICWGRAADWKDVIIALHERAFVSKAYVRFAVILLDSSGRFAESAVREMIADAATRLGIEQLVWLE